MKITMARLALLNIAIAILAIVGWLLFFQATITIDTLESQPTPTMSFEHRWGECALSMHCANCLERERQPGITSGLEVCWEETGMDEHMEIFGR